MAKKNPVGRPRQYKEERVYLSIRVSRSKYKKYKKLLEEFEESLQERLEAHIDRDLENTSLLKKAKKKKVKK